MPYITSSDPSGQARQAGNKRSKAKHGGRNEEAPAELVEQSARALMELRSASVRHDKQSFEKPPVARSSAPKTTSSGDDASENATPDTQELESVTARTRSLPKDTSPNPARNQTGQDDGNTVGVKASTRGKKNQAATQSTLYHADGAGDQSEGLENKANVSTLEKDEAKHGIGRPKKSRKRKRKDEDDGQSITRLGNGQRAPYQTNLNLTDDVTLHHIDALRELEVPIDPQLQVIDAVAAQHDQFGNRRPETSSGLDRSPTIAHMVPQDDQSSFDKAVSSQIPAHIKKSASRKKDYAMTDPPSKQDSDSVVPKSSKRSASSRIPASSSKHALTEGEVATLDAFRDHYCQDRGISTEQFNDMIQSNIRGNHRATSIFTEIQNLFPERPRSYVHRFCRRRYHNFHSRGVWTAEEDEALKRAVAEKGTSWKVVGEKLHRFAEDCRDRYRNYLHPSAEHRNRDQWTETEIVNLTAAILECTHRSRQEKFHHEHGRYASEIELPTLTSEEEREQIKDINWQRVSELMDQYGRPRSRLQCSFKWGKIKEDDKHRYLREVKEVQRNERALEIGNFTANNMKASNGWRLKRASRKVQNMRAGDKYDILRAVLDSAAPAEGNIPWRFVGDEVVRRKWSTLEKRAAWLMMKEQVEGADSMDYREVINTLMNRVLSEGIEERWDPEVHGWISGSRENQQGKKLEKARFGGDIDFERQEDLSDGATDDRDDLKAHNYRSPEPSKRKRKTGLQSSAPTLALPTEFQAQPHDKQTIDTSAAERSVSPNSLFDDAGSPVRSRKAVMPSPANGVSAELARQILDLGQAYGQDVQ